MKKQLALFAVPFLAIACSDAEQATMLEPPAISADVTTEGLVTQCLQVAVTCANNVTAGWVYYQIQPSGQNGAENCATGGGTDIYYQPVEQQRLRVEFAIVTPQQPSECDGQNLNYGFPVRTKCTVNGLDVGGKGLAKLVAKYVKADCLP